MNIKKHKNSIHATFYLDINKNLKETQPKDILKSMYIKERRKLKNQ